MRLPQSGDYILVIHAGLEYFFTKQTKHNSPITNKKG